MTEPTPTPEPPKLTEAEQTAKRRMDDAIQDLVRAAQGTTLLPMLPLQSLVVNLDSLVEVLCASGALSRVDYWTLVTVRLEEIAKECRRAVLARGGASALAGLRKPPGH